MLNQSCVVLFYKSGKDFSHDFGTFLVLWLTQLLSTERAMGGINAVLDIKNKKEEHQNNKYRNIKTKTAKIKTNTAI